MSDKKEKQITPMEYFKKLKESKCFTSTEDTKKFKEIALNMLKKAATLNQVTLAKKLRFAIECYEREEKILNAGYNTYLRKELVLEFLEMVNKIDKDAISIINLKDYPREIPDDIFNKVEKLQKDKIFDEYYVLFTDYTGKIQKDIEKEKREKDPVLFGCFINKKSNRPDIDDVFDRLYFIGDWVDEYCDITLDTILEKMSTKPKTIEIPMTEEKLKEFLDTLYDSGSKINANDFKTSNIVIMSDENIENNKSLFKKLKNKLKNWRKK